jgi:hypothetical protein
VFGVNEVAAARTFPSALFSVLGLVVVVSCGSADGKPVPAVDHRLDVSVCARNWRVVYSPEQERFATPGDNLQSQGGMLYFRQDLSRQSGIWSVSALTGKATRLYDQWARDFWIEDDRLLYVSSDFVLHGMPIGGGPAESIVYGATLEPNADVYVFSWALDRDALYWDRQRFGDSTSEFSIWRGERGSGRETSVSLPVSKDVGLVQDIIPVGEELLVSLSDGSVWAFPRTGGAVRQVPSSGQRAKFLGVSPAGEILWARYDGGFDGTRGSDRYVVSRGRMAGGQPEPFWPEKPPNAYAMGAWARGGGAWYVQTWEYGTDDATHLSVWGVDAQGKGTRLACDPEVASRFGSATVAPDGLYAIVQYTNLYIQIIAVRAPGND